MKNLNLKTAASSAILALAMSGATQAGLLSATDLDAGYRAGPDSKTAEGKCGGDKSAESKCGGDKPAESKCGEGKCGGDKAAESKCGEGKCGAI